VVEAMGAEAQRTRAQCETLQADFRRLAAAGSAACEAVRGTPSSRLFLVERLQEVPARVRFAVAEATLSGCNLALGTVRAHYNIDPEVVGNGLPAGTPEETVLQVMEDVRAASARLAARLDPEAILDAMPAKLPEE
jgi:hypothetical protein